MGFAVAAYIIVWIALFLYMLWLTEKNRKLATEMEELKRAITERSKD